MPAREARSCIASTQESRAEQHADGEIDIAGRIALAQADREFLVNELSRAVGLGGQPRLALEDTPSHELVNAGVLGAATP